MNSFCCFRILKSMDETGDRVKAIRELRSYPLGHCWRRGFASGWTLNENRQVTSNQTYEIQGGWIWSWTRKVLSFFGTLIRQRSSATIYFWIMLWLDQFLLFFNCSMFNFLSQLITWFREERNSFLKYYESLWKILALLAERENFLETEGVTIFWGLVAATFQPHSIPEGYETYESMNEVAIKMMKAEKFPATDILSGIYLVFASSCFMRLPSDLDYSSFLGKRSKDLSMIKVGPSATRFTFQVFFSSLGNVRTSANFWAICSPQILFSKMTPRFSSYSLWQITFHVGWSLKSHLFMGTGNRYFWM